MKPSWEVGLGWSVNRQKGDFRGKEAVFASEGKERFLFAGIVVDLNDMLAGGEKLLFNGEEVGVVNSPAYSHRMKKSLALVHVKPKAAAAGTTLEVVNDSMSCAATVVRIPFYDPEKTRTHQ
jgi:aminomethyltransferase